MLSRFRKGGRVDPETLPKGPNGNPLCRFCLKETRPPRRTFCSSDCVHQHKLRTSSSYLRQQVYLRDRGVCRQCGTDTKVIAQELWEVRILQGEAMMLRCKALHDIPAKRKVWKRKYGGSLWDADHIVSVQDGGGQCTTSNMQTLCIPCHQAKTAARRVLRTNK